MKTPIDSLAQKKAFSYVEVLYVLLIMGFVSLGLYQFTTSSAKSVFTSTEKNDIANNIRQFTGEMESVARSANVAYVYNSFQTSDRSLVSNRMRDGQSGDCVVFVTLQPNANPLNPDLITKIVGYFRKPDATGMGPVLRFELKYPSGVDSKLNSPESLLGGLSYNGTYPQVMQLAKGLANGKLFYNFLDKSVIIKAQIVQGDKAKRVTNTYNFTITPRG